MANKVQIKRGLFASLPTLDAGEFGFSTDTKQVHIGDGAANYEVVMHNLFDATTFLYATDDNTPVAKTPTEVMAILTGTAGAAFSMNTQKITNVVDPDDDQDAATKKYVDDAITGEDYWDRDSAGTISPNTPGDDLDMLTGNITLSGDIFTTGAIGRDTDNEINWGTDDVLNIVIGGVASAIASVSTGTGDNDKLVTQGYVDDAVATSDTFIELTDTPANYTDAAYKIVRVNAAADGLEYMAIVDGGTFA